MTSDLIERIAGATRSAAVLGGHYCVAPDLEDLSADADTEQNTFAFASKLVAAIRKQGKPAELVLWVNDIGIDPGERSQLKAQYRLPEPYAAILERLELPAELPQVLFESTVRNKASVLLRSLYKKNPERLRVLDSDTPELLRCIDRCEISPEVRRAYVMPGPEGENLVVKEGPNPKCNLILGTLFQMIEKRMAPQAIVTVFNAIYINRLRLGMHVAGQLLQCATPVHSLLMDGDELVNPGIPTWMEEPQRELAMSP